MGMAPNNQASFKNYACLVKILVLQYFTKLVWFVTLLMQARYVLHKSLRFKEAHDEQDAERQRPGVPARKRQLRHQDRGPRHDHSFRLLKRAPTPRAQ